MYICVTYVCTVPPRSAGANASYEHTTVFSMFTMVDVFAIEPKCMILLFMMPLGPLAAARDFKGHQPPIIGPLSKSKCQVPCKYQP